MSDTTQHAPDDVVVDLADNDNDDDLTSLLAKRQHARPNRATWVLLALVVLAVGFVGGAFSQKTWGTSSAATGRPDFAALAAGAGAAGSTRTAGGASAAGGQQTGGQQAGGFPGGGFGGLTVGTLTAVDGNTLTITGQDGTTTTVTVPDSAEVTASSKVPLSGLTVGESVVVAGKAGDDGTVTASSVSQGGGGFPGGGQGRSGATSTDQQQPNQPTTAPTQGDAS